MTCPSEPVLVAEVSCSVFSRCSFSWALHCWCHLSDEKLGTLKYLKRPWMEMLTKRPKSAWYYFSYQMEESGSVLPGCLPSAEENWLPYVSTSAMLFLPGLLSFYTYLFWHLVFLSLADIWCHPISNIFVFYLSSKFWDKESWLQLLEEDSAAETALHPKATCSKVASCGGRGTGNSRPRSRNHALRRPPRWGLHSGPLFFFFLTFYFTLEYSRFTMFW